MYVSLDGFGNSRHPRTYLSLPCIYTHTVIYSYENPCVVLRLSTFTNDPEKPCYSPEMATLLAGESGPDARAEKRQRHWHETPLQTLKPARRLSSRDEKCGPQYASYQCCNAVGGEDDEVGCTQPPSPSFFPFFFPCKNVVGGESFGGNLALMFWLLTLFFFRCKVNSGHPGD